MGKDKKDKMYSKYRDCPRCKMPMEYGIRWSRSRRKIKRFYFCPNCRTIFYKTDLDNYS